MSETRLSPEVLAAFIDGTLDPSERERVMAILADSPGDYEDLLDTVAVAVEMDPPTLTSTGVRGGRWRYVLPALAAAGIAIAFLLPRPEAPSGVVATLAAAIPFDHAAGQTLEMRLGPLWDQAGWTVTRGTGISLPGSAVAFRLGARGVLYEVAAGLSDRAAATVVRAELQGLLRSLRGGAPVAALYAPELLDDTDSRAERGPALERVADDRASFRLGAAIEVLRLTMATAPSAPVLIPAVVPETLADARRALSTEQEPLRVLVNDLLEILRSAEIDLEQLRQSVRATMEFAGH